MYRTILCLAMLHFASSIVLGLEPTCPPNSKCCPDGACYNLCSPWKSHTRNLPPPNCLKDPVTYLLYTRKNLTYPVVFKSRNFTLIYGYYDASKPTVMVIHDYKESNNTGFMTTIIDAYLEKVDCNAIFVDYSSVTMNPDYYQAASDMRVAAIYLTITTDFLRYLGTKPSQIHLIGFGLGAHLACMLANKFPGIGCLTALDPAGPAFTGESCEVRCCKGSANYTEAIHTNGHPKYGYGTTDLNADVDFLVNGGCYQPGCLMTGDPLVIFSLSKQRIADPDGKGCSHIRAQTYYLKAIYGDSTFWGVKVYNTSQSERITAEDCASCFDINTRGCTADTCVPMGLQARNATGRGKFFVRTTGKSPFCVSRP